MTDTTKHTPGPWEVCGPEWEKRPSIRAAHGGLIACTEHGGDDGRANAALIAQAPALLARVAELEAALEMADKWEADGRPDGIMHLIARLRAALAGGAK